MSEARVTGFTPSKLSCFVKNTSAQSEKGVADEAFPEDSPRPGFLNTNGVDSEDAGGQVEENRERATLANMEFLRMTIVPKGFSAPGLNAFTGMGSSFVNGLGERFMSRYHPMAEKAPRNWLVWGTLNEVREGRGPVFIDSRHLPPEKIAHLKNTLGLDKETMDDFFKARRIDIAKEPLEVTVSEAMQTGPVEVVGSGIHIDRNCMSTLEGLFAAGDCADQMKVVHMAVAGGYAAGRFAAEYAQKNTLAGWDEKIVKEEWDRIMAPLGRKEGLPYRELEDVLRKIMTEHVGPIRTRASLETAQKKLHALFPYLEEIKAENFHELMRSVETASLMKVGAIMSHAAPDQRQMFSLWKLLRDLPRRRFRMVRSREKADSSLSGRMLALRRLQA